MSYDIAQLIIEGKIKNSWEDCKISNLPSELGPIKDFKVKDIVEDILNLNKIAIKLRKKRTQVKIYIIHNFNNILLEWIFFYK